MDTLLEYKCPCCNGELTFNSDIQKMKCPYCDTEFETETLKNYDQVLKSELSEDVKWDGEAPENSDVPEGMVAYICNSCRGQIITEKTTAASRCPYCDNPIVMIESLAGVMKPDWVIPFKLDKESAVKNFEKHLLGKKFLPKEFKSQAHIQEIKGIYVPFWLYNCDADASVSYRGTKVRKWYSGGYDYTETSHYHITRAGNLGFEKVPVDGSIKMPDDLMDSIEPYNYNEMVDFQTAFLAGYLADKYDVDSKTSETRANRRIKESTSEAFRKTVTGYATVIEESNSLQLKNKQIKYALLPVWMLTTNYKGQKYIFAMNGQTGKFVGNLPLDKGKFARTFATIAGAITVIGTLATYLLF